MSVSLSDINGYDPIVHHATARGTLEALLDIFDQVPEPPLRSLDELWWVYRRLDKFRATLRADLYRPHTYRQLVLAAKVFVVQRSGGDVKL